MTTTSILQQLADSLSLEQLAAIGVLKGAVAPTAALVAAPVVPAVLGTSTYYDESAATPVLFRAALAATPKAKDPSYAERFDHVWCKGSYGLKGPKGGVYLVARCVMGVKRGQQVKGTLRIGNTRFLQLLAGGSADCWFREDGAKDAVLVGTLSAYQVVQPKER